MIVRAALVLLFATGLSQRSYRLVFIRDGAAGWRLVRWEPGPTT
jgi:hypothetical protein